MQVILERAIFTNPSNDESGLITLFYLGYQGRHHIRTEPEWNQDKPFQEIDDWLKQQSLKLCNECQLALELGLEGVFHPSSFTVRVSGEKKEGNKNEVVLPLKKAVDFLILPFKILVEDAIRDRDFLLAIATVNQELKNKLQLYYEKKWVEFEHGCGLLHMQERVKEIKYDKQDKMRIWVLFDSDALRPKSPSKDSDDLKRICGKTIHHHQLQRRAIENYLPIELLKHWLKKGENNTNKEQRKKNRRLVRTLQALSLEQRYHFNMKGGFQGDQNRQDKDRVGDLYDDLDDKTLRDFSHGFGGKIAELFKEADAIKKTWLLNDNQSVETEAMLNKLLNLI
jgi:hypothetical protein